MAASGGLHNHVPVPRPLTPPDAAPVPTPMIPHDNVFNLKFPPPTELQVLRFQGIVANNANATDKKRFNYRRATQEAVARELGYTVPRASDADSLSSHDKKRLYLDCLEQYIVHLHEYMQNKGISPVPIERVSSGRGLTSRSLRTLLIHLQSEASSLFHLQRQNSDLQRDMREFYNSQLAAYNDGSGADYPSASTSIPMPPTPHGVDLHAAIDFPVYINAEGCYTASFIESTAAHSPNMVGDLASPRSLNGTEHTPSFVDTTPTGDPMSSLAAHVVGPVPPDFGLGPASGRPSAAYSQAQQRRCSIATTPSYHTPASHTRSSSSFHQLQCLNIVQDNGDDVQMQVNGNGQHPSAPDTSAGMHISNTYIDSNGVYVEGARTSMYDFPPTHQAPQNLNQPALYPSGVVVPSNAPPASHTDVIHAYRVGAPSSADHSMEGTGAYPQRRGYQLP